MNRKIYIAGHGPAMKISSHAGAVRIGNFMHISLNFLLGLIRLHDVCLHDKAHAKFRISNNSELGFKPKILPRMAISQNQVTTAIFVTLIHTIILRYECEGTGNCQRTTQSCALTFDNFIVTEWKPTGNYSKQNSLGTSVQNGAQVLLQADRQSKRARDQLRNKTYK